MDLTEVLNSKRELSSMLKALVVESESIFRNFLMREDASDFWMVRDAGSWYNEKWWCLSYFARFGGW